MTLAAVSQYAKDADMTQSSALITSMMADASDGIMQHLASSGGHMPSSDGHMR